MGRRTGLLLANIYQGSSRAVWRYAAQIQHQHPEDALVMIPGGRIGFLGASEYLRNSIYELVDSASLDGAVIWSSSLTGAENADSITSFVRGISERLPVVSMCMDIPGIPSVDFDAYAGTYQATMHFIKDHGARRIAFLRGPASHRSAEARYKAYLDALRDGGIEPDPDLVTSPRPWSEGAEAASELICARKTVEEVRESLGADSLSFLSEAALFKAARRSELCLACFNGHYPTALYRSIEEANKDGKF